MAVTPSDHSTGGVIAGHLADPFAGSPETCGCCGPDRPVPGATNRPGLDAVAYRIGTHGSFLRRMLAALPRAPRSRPGGGAGPLARLTTRCPDDPAIALLDAWAVAADVLTFYQERIANEGYLRTATELRSVLELARAIGYELRPGVAASTYLAFSVEDAPGAPRSARVGAGTLVRSLPGQDEKPQAFETVEDIHARAEWNAIRARRLRPQPIELEQRHLRLRGVTTGLQPGDGLLIVGDERIESPGDERWEWRVLTSVETVPPTDPTDEGHTVVRWTPPLGMDENRPIGPPRRNPRVYAFRLRASLFGHNAPDWRTMAVSVKQAYKKGVDPNNSTTWGDEWPGFEPPGGRGAMIDLDQVYPRIVEDSWVVLEKPGYVELYRVLRATTAAKADFGLAGTVTSIQPDIRENLRLFDRRSTVVHAVSDELFPSMEPVPSPIERRRLELESPVEGLREGQPVVVTGKLPDAAEQQPPLSEVAFVERLEETEGQPVLHLLEPLQRAYDPATVTINANVARATHGETVDDEALGGGDARVPFQRFSLGTPPLTHVSAPTASGAESTLEVRVNGVRWDEAPSLYGLGPADERYVARRDDRGRTTVVFGDGRSGARLPTGQENVRATYRAGLGAEGNVGADRISLIQTRALGIRSVTNPLPASGGTPPEALADARENAPRTVLTLDRVVSLRDYEDFARGFAGIAKAAAASIWTGHANLVHVTVAGPEGAVLDPSSETIRNLLAAIDGSRDPVEEVRVAPYRPLLFRVAAEVLVDERYLADRVLADVRAALLNTFSFARRGFGQPTFAGEVVTVIQEVEGVVACDLNALFAVDPAAGGPPPPARETILLAESARLAGDVVVAAQLLLVDPQGIELEEMSREREASP